MKNLSNVKSELKQFNDLKLDVSEFIFGGDIVPTNEGCPDEADFYDTVTGRYSVPEYCK